MKPGTKRGGVGRDPEIARAGEGEARAGDGPVDGGDHRLLERADRADVRVVGLLEPLLDRLRHLAELLQILTGAEALAGARDHDGADAGVGRLRQRLREACVEGGVERVVDLRAVERDREDGALARGQDFAHGAEPSRRASALSS